MVIHNDIIMDRIHEMLNRHKGMKVDIYVGKFGTHIGKLDIYNDIDKIFKRIHHVYKKYDTQREIVHIFDDMTMTIDGEGGRKYFRDRSIHS